MLCMYEKMLDTLKKQTVNCELGCLAQNRHKW